MENTFSKYIGQSKIGGGVMFHYTDPQDNSAYPKVESIFMSNEQIAAAQSGH